MKIKSIIAAPLLLLTIMLLSITVGIIPKEVLGLDTNPYLSTVILQLIIFALPALFFCTLRGSGYVSSLRIRVPSPSSALIMIFVLLLMISGGSLIEYTVSALSNGGAGSQSIEYAAFAASSSLFDKMYIILVFALLPAITEEIIFRGIILTEYSTVGIGCSVFMSSVMFALSHFNPYHLPLYFFCGLLLAVLTYATRSVTAAMIVHALYNIFIIFFENYIVHISEKQNISGMLFVIILASVAIISASVAAFEISAVYRGYARNNIPSDYVPKKKKGFFAGTAASVLSPAFIILTVVYIIAVLIEK